MVFGKWKKMDSKYLSSFTAIYIFECVLLPLKISNFYSYLCLDFYRTWLKIWATRRVSFKKQELLTLCKHTSWTRVFFGGGVVFLMFLVFCVVLLCVFTFWVPCCDVCYDFRIKQRSVRLPPVACRRAHVLFTLFVFFSV